MTHELIAQWHNYTRWVIENIPNYTDNDFNFNDFMNWLISNEHKEINKSTNMKTQEENPNGLHAKYHVQKIVQDGTDFFGNANYIYQDAPKDAEYFVLRLDDNQKDKIHCEACIKAILTYADAIKDHLPELSKDLLTKYQPNNTI